MHACFRSSLVAAALMGTGALPATADSLIEDATRFTVKLRVSVEHPFWGDQKGTGNGTGFLVDRARGWIVTNAHIAGRSPAKVNVIFKDRPPIAGRIHYVDTHLDMAVVEVAPAGIPATAEEAKLGCADPVVPGQQVVAFGHPWSLDFTATRGIVSGVRFLNDTESIQTDATINPGNSGGALIDERTRRVIGLNEATYGNNRGSIGLAAPMRLVCTIIDLMREGVDPAPPRLPARFATTAIDGELFVAEAKEPWAGALMVGDRVRSINGEAQRMYVSRIVDKARGQRTIELGIERGGVAKTVTLEIPAARIHAENEGLLVGGMLIAGSPFAGVRPFAGLFEDALFVHNVDDASSAEIAHFRKHDQIISIDGRNVVELAQAREVLNAKRDSQVLFIVRRKKSTDDLNYRYFALKMTPDEILPVSTAARGANPGLATDTTKRATVQ